MIDLLEWIDRTEDFLLRHKKRLKAAFIVLFALVWMNFLIAALTAGACRDESKQARKRISYCNVSLAAGVWMDVFPTEYRKRSLIQLHRGIALLQADQLLEARADFTQAIKVFLRYSKNEGFRNWHMELVNSHPDPRVEPFWKSTLDEITARAKTDG